MRKNKGIKIRRANQKDGKLQNTLLREVRGQWEEASGYRRWKKKKFLVLLIKSLRGHGKNKNFPMTNKFFSAPSDIFLYTFLRLFQFIKQFIFNKWIIVSFGAYTFKHCTHILNQNKNLNYTNLWWLVSFQEQSNGQKCLWPCNHTNQECDKCSRRVRGCDSAECYYLTPLQLIPHQPRSQSLSGFSSPEADFIVHHGDERSLGAALFVAMEACTAGRYACTR